MLNLSRPLAKSPTQRLLGTWGRFLSFNFVLHYRADSGAFLTPYSEIGLEVYRGYPRRLDQELLKGIYVPSPAPAPFSLTLLTLPYTSSVRVGIPTLLVVRPM